MLALPAPKVARAVWLAMAATVILLGAEGCALLPRETARFRMTVALDVAGAVQEQSRVIEVAWRFNRTPFGTPSFESLICGRAILFDLGERGHLLAMLQPDFSHRAESAGIDEIALRAFSSLPKSPYRSEAPDSALREAARFRGRIELPPELLPQFVWVRSPVDVTSAVPVEPSELPKMIGADISLKGVRLETIAERPETAITPAPRWLLQMRAGQQPSMTGAMFKFLRHNVESDDCDDWKGLLLPSASRQAKNVRF